MKKHTNTIIIAAIIAAIIILTIIKRKPIMQTVKTATAGLSGAFEKQLYSSLKAANFPEILALMIVSQSKYETSVLGIPYKSRNFLINNNSFGYKYVKGNKFQLQGNTSPEGNAYAKYATLQDGINDIIRHYEKRKSTFFPLTDLAAFANALKTQEYFGQSASAYEKGCRVFYKTSII